MYRIVGGDRKEYGPVTEDQLRQWIAEGRADARTLARFNDGPWKPLSTFPEFAPALAQAPAPPPPPPGTAPVPPRIPGPGPTAYPGYEPRNNNLAVAGLVLSVLSLVCCGPLFATLGLLFSIAGLYQINQNPGMYSGKGLAIGGIVVALAAYVLFAILYFSGVLDELIRSLPRP